MIYLYDGSFDGYLTVIFDSYKVLDSLLGIEEVSQQLVAFEDSMEIRTDGEKARRVENSLIRHFGWQFFYDLRCLYLSVGAKKEFIGAKVVQGIYRQGIDFLGSADYHALNFQRIVTNVKREVHTYLGLLRFDLLQEEVLFSTFTPKNNILTLVYPHFAKRMPLEKFVIADVGRKLALMHGEGGGRLMTYDKKLEPLSKEDPYGAIWKAFYEHIAIDQRYDPKGRQHHMPKKYWRHLTELN